MDKSYSLAYARSRPEEASAMPAAETAHVSKGRLSATALRGARDFRERARVNNISRSALRMTGDVQRLSGSMSRRLFGAVRSISYLGDFMKLVKEQDINNGQSLTDEQINRICHIVEVLAKHSNNAQAVTLAHNLKYSKDIKEKRKWIVLFYISCFQLLSFVNTARDKDIPMDAFKLEVAALFRKDVEYVQPNKR